MFEANSIGDLASVFGAWAPAFPNILSEFDGGFPSFFLFEESEGSFNAAFVKPLPFQRVRGLRIELLIDDVVVNLECLTLAPEFLKGETADVACSIPGGHWEVFHFDELIVKSQSGFEAANLVGCISAKDEEAPSVTRGKFGIFEELLNFDEREILSLTVDMEAAKIDGCFAGQRATFVDQFGEAKDRFFIG